MTWPTKKLGEVCELVRGTEPGSESYFEESNKDRVRFIRVQDLTGKLDNPKFVNKSLKHLTLVKPNEILISFDGTPGIVVRGWDGAISSGIRVIRNLKPEISKDFLFYYLQTSQPQEVIKFYTTGVTILHASRAIPHIEISVPSISNQRKIVEELDAIKETQELNNKQLVLADELFQSLLHRELDPKGKNWEIKKLPEVAKLGRGKFTPRPRNDPRYFGGSIPWIQTGDIVNSNGFIRSYPQTLNEEGLKVSKVFPKNTIAITIAANIGDLAILGIDAAFPDSIVGIRANEKFVDHNFLYFQLLLTKKYLNSVATQAAQKNINLAILSKIDILLPSMKIQKQIVEKLSAVQEYKKKLLEQKQKLQELFESVLNKSFKGQL